ncbi:ATP-dependent helicase/nuclease subunit A [Clostridia bacterium]|nr:ATP-dependent helicase/nuclease subunit A [Clostridia bacterium]
MGFTPQQQKAIESRGSDILVSAAAGSGKTSVLTERIVRLVAEDRIPLGRILVVTFTDAAAAEMKSRISLALESASAKGDDFIEAQLRRLGSAKISTFHGFALTVLRRHYASIDLDPSFSVCDELRQATLKEEAMEETFSRVFAMPEEYAGFTDFLRNYAGPKEERSVQSMVQKTFEFIMTLPNPENWLERAVADLYGDPDAFLSSEAMRFARAEILWRIRIARSLTDRVGEDLLSNGFPSLAAKNQTDLDGILAMEAAFLSDDYEALRSLLGTYKRARFVATKKETENGWADRRPLIKVRRDRVNDIFQSLRETFYARGMEEYTAEIRYVAPYAEMLVCLVKLFAEVFAETKRRENMIDFSDIEHMALEILAKDSIAEEYHKNLDYIFIDEYQDSNYVQDAIVKRIARKDNVFMVGDVKQSIYKFRNAEPAIFLEKLERFSKGVDGIRIDLSANFRSKISVIDAVNAVFEQVMEARYSRIEYGEGQRLEAGLPCGLEANRKTRLYLAAKDSAKAVYANTAESEAAVCVRIIHELVGQDRFDAKANCMRPIQYRDIVILLRSAKGTAEPMRKILEQHGIPTFTDRGEGYFETVEIETFLGLLKTIINTRRDIPLAASLCSAAFGFDLAELADIRLGKTDGYFYEAFLAYAETGADSVLADKCRQVIDRLALWRNDERFMPLDEFLWKLMRESGYFDYAGVLPNGPQRQANLRGLLDRAQDFQKGRVRGLRAFVSYLDRVKKKVAVPQIKLLSEGEDVVRLMTIHGSKGLEFPVVIQCGLGDSFSRGGSGDDGLLLHYEAGLSLQWENRRAHTYKKTLPHHAIRLRRDLDERAEDVRLLYVSMTRAMDQLCLIGTVSNPDAVLDLYADMDPALDTDVPGAKNYLELILPAAYARRDLFEITAVSAQDTGTQDTGTGLLSCAPQQDRRPVPVSCGFVYPYADASLRKVKYSVTELTAASRETARRPVFYSAGSPGETEEDAGLSGQDLTASEKGTALHKALELLDFAEAYQHRGDMDFFETYLSGLRASGVLTDAEVQVTRADFLSRFASSDLCARAARAEFMIKEAPFNMRLPEEGIIVQGVIDLLFREEGGLVVADYKSGHFVPDRPGEEERIRETYGGQIAFYRRAAEQVFGEPVKETFLYMTRVGICIST